MNLDDDSYQQFLLDCCKDCRCCRECQMPPCAGVTAGGICDGMCWCSDPDEDPVHEEDDDGGNQ